MIDARTANPDFVDGMREAIRQVRAKAVSMETHGYGADAMANLRTAWDLERLNGIALHVGPGCGVPLTMHATCGGMTQERGLALCDACIPREAMSR